MRKFKSLLLLSFTIVFVGACVTACTVPGSSTSGNNRTGRNNTEGNIGNAVENAGEHLGNAVENVGDAAGNLLGSNGFNSYNEAHEHFLKTMSGYNTNAKYEVRDENKNLADYQEGSKGYYFSLYDTSSNTKGEHVGEFYVDTATGRIYHKDKSTGKINEYKHNNNNKTNNVSKAR